MTKYIVNVLSLPGSPIVSFVATIGPRPTSLRNFDEIIPNVDLNVDETWKSGDSDSTRFSSRLTDCVINKTSVEFVRCR